MQDKAEAAAVFLTMITAVSAIALQDLLSINTRYVGDVAVLLMWSYSIFWAFSIRRLLSAKLYRNQALGVGFVTIGWATLNYSFILPGSTIPEVAIILALLLTFYWIDASVLAGRKSDPLYRNTLHWKELRLVLWPIMAVASAAEYVGLLINPSGFTIVAPSGISATPSPLALLLLLATFFAVFVPGPVYLLATGSRSGDRTLRKHLQWFGWFAASFSSLLFLGVGTGEPVLIGLGYAIGTYCLYRSAKSLAPLNRLSLGRPVGKNLLPGDVPR